MEPRELAILVACIGCAVTFGSVLVARPWRAQTNPRLRSLPAIAVAVSFVGAMFALVGRDLGVFWPRGGFQWLLWSAVACAGVAVIEAAFGLKKIVLTLIGAGVIVGAMLLIGESRLTATTRGWSAEEGTFWIGLSAAIALTNVIAGSITESKLCMRPVLVGWTVAIVLGAFIVGLLGKSERLSLLMITLGGAAGGLMLASFMWCKFHPAASVWLTLSVLSIGIVSAAMDQWYAYLPVPQAILVLCAPLACLAAFLADRSRVWKPILVVALLVVALLSWPLAESYETYQQYRAMGFAP
jgi:hypothetical protein